MTCLESIKDQKSHWSAQLSAQGLITNGLRFPTSRDEYWKYTRTNTLVEAEYLTDLIHINTRKGFELLGLDAHYVVTVNGRFDAALSSPLKQEGIMVRAFSQMGDAETTVVDRHLGAYVDAKSHAFTALNTAGFADGVFIEIQAGVSLDKPICLLHIQKGEQRLSHVRHLMVLGTSAKATVLERYVSEDAKNGFTNAVVETVVNKEAKLEWIILQDEQEGSSQIHTTHIRQHAHSVATIITATLSGNLIRNNLNFEVQGEGCESNMFGIYFTSGNQHVDNHTFVDHLVPHCNSNELFKGVMADRSTGVFNGKIMVRQDAQQTNAFQSNQNILLSDRATINTKPELEIYADDVKCSHGCTIGQLDDEALFYLQSRGLSKAAATQLLVQAFAGEVIEKVSDETIRQHLTDAMQSKFDHLHV
jgi:Fe-S cluster assembly protein SufD